MNNRKQCKKCKEFRDLSLFAKDKNKEDGLQNYCKLCQKSFRKSLKKGEPKQSEKNEPTQSVEFKICPRCNKEKYYTDYIVMKESNVRFNAICKECREKYCITDDENYYTKSIREQRVEWFRKFKAGKPCTDCGRMLNPELMDYDHIKGDKVKNVSRMVLDHTPKNKILKEIDKCELVCLFCHNKRTIERFGKTEYPQNVIRNINIINEYKNKPCSICGVQYDYCNMQFDHVTSESKLANICQLKRTDVGYLLKELAKCEVLCAACHRMKSLKEQKEGKYKKIEENIKEIFIDYNDKVKECVKCKEIKSFNLFYKNNNKLDDYCKECTNWYKKLKNKNNLS